MYKRKQKHIEKSKYYYCDKHYGHAHIRFVKDINGEIATFGIFFIELGEFYKKTGQKCFYWDRLATKEEIKLYKLASIT